MFTRFLPACCVAVACLTMLAPAPAADEKTDKKKAEVKLREVNHEGFQKAIEGLKGKVVVVDAWATWCPPCVKEFPQLVKVHQKYAAQGVACVSLSVDGLEDREQVQKFLEKQEATFDNLISSEETETMLNKLGVPSVPAVFVFDRTGKLLGKFSDEDPYSHVLPLVEKQLEKK